MPLHLYAQISPDGHCLFSAIGDQLAVLGLIAHSQTSYPTIRQAAADYIEAHPDDFIPFLPMESEDSADGGLMSPEELKDYCAKVRETAVWGGEPEIMALANAYRVPIHVIQAATPHIVVHNPSDQVPLDDSKILRISYHRRMYGLGEVSTLPFLINMCIHIPNSTTTLCGRSVPWALQKASSLSSLPLRHHHRPPRKHAARIAVRSQFPRISRLQITQYTPHSALPGPPWHINNPEETSVFVATNGLNKNSYV